MVGKIGAGTVRSTPPGIDCGAACSASFDAGTNVVLRAVADAGWTFAGWSGACSGTGACSVALGADGAVYATFQAVAPRPGPTHRLDVAPSGNGKGRVTSNPGGIDCAPGCSATFADGSVVTLTATPEAGAQFGGWGGACSGTGTTCTLTLSGDMAATATFSLQPPPDECAGLRPAPPGPPPHSHLQGVLTSTGGNVCVPGVGDGTGTLVLVQQGYHRQKIDFVSSSGQPLNSPDGDVLHFTDLLSGFISTDYAGAGRTALTAWDSTGHVIAYANAYGSPSGPAFRGGGAFQDPLGGVVANDGQSYDAQLRQRWDAAVDREGGPAVVGVDRAGRSLFVFGTSRYGPNTFAAEWVDHEGHVVTSFQWVDGGLDPRGPLIHFEPRVGDGFFIGYDGTWIRQIDSLATVTKPAPAWLQARPNTSLHMVHDGRGYAVLPAPGSDSATCSQTVEVFAPSGNSCGVATFAAGTGSCKMKAVTVGFEGTVIQQLPDSKEQQCWFGPCTCTWQWWPGFFR